MVKVRGVVPDDVPDIFALIKAKAAFDGCADSLQIQQENLHQVFFAPQPKASAIVATIEDKVVGIATYYSIFSTFLGKPGIWLDDLFIFEAYRKFGLGKALMRGLCDIAREEGCARIDWIVANDNDNGKAFYKALGATIFEDIRLARLDEKAIAALR